MDSPAKTPFEPVSRLALEWLREVLGSEFASDAQSWRSAARPSRVGRTGAELRPGARWADDPFEVAARYARGEAQHALWYREWHRRWRRFQLVDHLRRYSERLNRAREPEAVYRTLSECAVQVVGGYTCLLFPPHSDSPMRPLPNPALRVDAGRLSISIPLPQPGVIGHDDVLGERGGPLASLAPLFSEERAVSLAHAPFGDGGVILLVERRHERVFEPDDWELLRLLAAQAAAALARVRLAERLDVLAHADLDGGLPDEPQLLPVLEHAVALAEQGEPLCLMVFRLTGLAEMAIDDGPAAAERVRRTAAEVLRELGGSLGLVVRRAADEFVLVLPLRAAQPEAMSASLRRQLPRRVQLRCGSAEYEPGAVAEVLLAQALESLDESTAAVRRPSCV